MSYSKQYIGDHGTHFSTIDGKEFSFTYGDRGSRGAAREKAEAHDRNRTKAIEKRLGRVLTDTEYLDDNVIHRDSRDLLTREREAKFKPVRKPPGRYEKMKSELLTKIEEKRVMAMPTLERQLYDVERMEARDAEEIAESNAKEAHLKNPRTKTALKELNKLLESTQWDASRDAGEVQRIKNAIAQNADHLGDADIAETMLREVLDCEDSRKAAIEEAKHEQIRQIEATLLGDRKPRKVEIPFTGDLLDDGHALFNAMCDGDFSHDEVTRVRLANDAFRENEDSAAIERLIECFAVGPEQTIAE